MCVCVIFNFPDAFLFQGVFISSSDPAVCVCKQCERLGGFQSQKRMHWLSNLQAGEEFGPPDALCTNAVLHVILFNMNKSLIYQKSITRCVFLL